MSILKQCNQVPGSYCFGTVRVFSSRVTLIILLILFCLSLSVSATVTGDKTHSDVYYQVQLLVEDVQLLRKHNKISSPWPKVAKEVGYQPRHVFQKVMEIMAKINSYRTNIIKTGPIVVSRFPGRDITPNEVYSIVVSLRNELNLLLQSASVDQKRSKSHQQAMITTRTPSDAYAVLAEVSIALGETLGLRGFTPSDVYARSFELVELSRFLRHSQNYLKSVPLPARGSGKLPNHTLQAVHQFMSKVKAIEENLWMPALIVNDVPKRVISPSDVYDAIGVAIAELKAIQYRLGLEREFLTRRQFKDKNPDDVIQNIRWAMAMLPDFSLNKPLQQFNRDDLIKTPNHVFSVTDHVLSALKRYSRMRGIPVKPRRLRQIQGLKPQHVYGKGLEILEKVNLLRIRQKQGSMSVPNFPLRTITPTEVFELAILLDEELTLLFRAAGIEMMPWIHIENPTSYSDKLPSDVFYNMQEISYLLDSILGTEGFTPGDVYSTAVALKQEVILIAERVGKYLPDDIGSVTEMRSDIQPKDVLAFSQKVIALIVQIKRRAGMFGLSKITLTPATVVTPNDVYNQVRLIETELIELKVFLGIISTVKKAPVQPDKTPGDVLQILEYISRVLEIILHADAEEPL